MTYYIEIKLQPLLKKKKLNGCIFKYVILIICCLEFCQVSWTNYRIALDLQSTRGALV